MLKTMAVLMLLCARGFLPKASIVLLELLPKVEKPMIKVAATISAAKMYLSDSTGLSSGDREPDLNASSKFVFMVLFT